MHTAQSVKCRGKIKESPIKSAIQIFLKSSSKINGPRISMVSFEYLSRIISTIFRLPFAVVSIPTRSARVTSSSCSIDAK